MSCTLLLMMQNTETVSYLIPVKRVKSTSLNKMSQLNLKQVEIIKQQKKDVHLNISGRPVY